MIGDSDSTAGDRIDSAVDDGREDATPPAARSPGAASLSDLSRVYLEVRASLVRYTSRFFKRSQEAEDVVQEAFVKVIEAQRKRDIQSPRRYLFRTARNLSLQQLRKSAYKLTDEIGDLLLESELMESKTMEEQFEARENFEMFCRAVRSLPLKCRRAYVLCRVYGYTQKEVAAHMGIGVKAVEGHLSRATLRCLDFIEAERAAGEARLQHGDHAPDGTRRQENRHG